MKRTLALLLLLVTPLVLAACSAGSGSSGGGGRESGAATVGDAAVGSSPSGGGSSAGETAPARGVLARSASLPSAGPRIVQTAALRLTVARDGFEDAVESARTIASVLGGFVVSSSERRDPGERTTSGTLVLRVPSERYADAMQRLADVGKIVGREETGRDVSAEFVDLGARKRHLEAVETQLLKLLNRAGTVAAALAVQSRLDDVQLELEQVRGRLRFLDEQTAFATITLSLRERPPAAVASDDGGVLNAWSRGAHAFAHVAAQTFVVLATVAPVVLLLALAALAFRIVFRRRPLPRLGGGRS